MKGMEYCSVMLLLAAFIGVSSCGGFNLKKMDSFSEKCKAEHIKLEPETPEWQNISSSERRKKRKEIEDYKKQRIALYKALYDYKEIYAAISERGGGCTPKECDKLEKMRLLMVECCPVAAQIIPEMSPR